MRHSSPYTDAVATLNQVLETLRRLEPILREHHVLRAGVFGSVARGDARADSDVDILVEMGPSASLFDLSGTRLILEEALGCSVDVVSIGGMKPDIRARVLSEVRYAA